MRISNRMRLASTVLAVGLVATACGGTDDSTDDESTADSGGESEEADGGATSGDGATLDAVLERGELICGVNGQLSGFSQNNDGEYSGLDVDYCKAVAAAVLGDADAVDYVDLNSEQRFPALQSGQVDVLIRNGTWTASRDGSLGFTWLATTYYDGQGMLVTAESPFESIDDMEGATICVQTGTTTELNLETYMSSRGLSYEPINVADEAGVTQNFVNGTCQAYTTDRSGLASFAADYDGDVRILSDVMSKEPLGPAVREGDPEWADIVQWVVFATIQAEEYGLDSTNIGSYDGGNPDVQRFVDSTDEDTDLGFPEPGWTVRVIEAVGNYQEIFDRNIVPLGLDEGVNQLWTEGGLLYAPPYR